MRLLGCVFIALYSCFVIGQTTQNAVTWGEPGRPFKVIFVDGRPIERYFDHKILIDVFEPIRNDQRIYTVTILVGNASEREIEVIPSEFSALVSDPKHPHALWADGDQVIAAGQKAAEHHNRVGAFLEGFGAGAQTQTATVNSSDGTSSTISYHDPSATERAERDVDSRKLSTQQRFALLHSQVLRRNTIEPKDHVIGRVYFSTDKETSKNATVTEVDVPLEGITYRFLWNGAEPVAIP